MTADHDTAGWGTPRRRGAAYRLHAVATDCHDIADHLLTSGPRPEDADLLAEAGRQLLKVASELRFFYEPTPADGEESDR